MSVQIEKNRIIISIPSTDPENDLKDLQGDIIFLMKNFDHDHLSYNFYQPLSLLDAMIPDRNTYQQKEEEEPKHDMEPLTKLVSSYDPLTLAKIFTTAQMYIWKYIALLHEKNGKHDVELEDVAADLKSFSDVFEQMAKQADKVCV